jgi:hypothetical protein
LHLINTSLRSEIKPESSEQPSADENIVPSPSLSAAAELPRRLALKSLVKELNWRSQLKLEFEKPYMKEIQRFLEAEEKVGLHLCGIQQCC